MYAYSVPGFATPILAVSSEDDIESSEGRRARVNSELCCQAFDAGMKGLVPTLRAARALDDDLIRFFLHCHRTWEDGAVVFRDGIFEILKYWEHLGLAKPCPYPLPTDEELRVHQDAKENHEATLSLKEQVMSVLHTPPDGWVPTDCWDATKEAHDNAFNLLLQTIQSDRSSSEQELRLHWPFDIPTSNSPHLSLI